MRRSQPMLALLGLLSFLHAAHHHHNLPWQHYYTLKQRWVSSKGSRPARIRTGQGRYWMAHGMAELVCEFPYQYKIISNIIWERADLGAYESLDKMYNLAGEKHNYRVIAWPQGSRLELMSPSPKARGLYRCLATGMSPTHSYPVTLFQDIPFYPNMRSKWLDKSPLVPFTSWKPCCRGLRYDDYSHHSEYHIKTSHYFE